MPITIFHRSKIGAAEQMFAVTTLLVRVAISTGSSPHLQATDVYYARKKKNCNMMNILVDYCNYPYPSLRKSTVTPRAARPSSFPSSDITIRSRSRRPCATEVHPKFSGFSISPQGRKRNSKGTSKIVRMMLGMCRGAHLQ